MLRGGFVSRLTYSQYSATGMAFPLDCRLRPGLEHPPYPRWFGAAPLYTQLCRLSATIIALTVLCATSADAKVDPDSEYLKQVRREGHTELCRAVGKPSNRLAAAINSAMEQDPTWAAEAAWFQRIAQAYERAGCGDA